MAAGEGAKLLWPCLQQLQCGRSDIQFPPRCALRDLLRYHHDTLPRKHLLRPVCDFSIRDACSGGLCCIAAPYRFPLLNPLTALSHTFLCGVLLSDMAFALTTSSGALVSASDFSMLQMITSVVTAVYKISISLAEGRHNAAVCGGDEKVRCSFLSYFFDVGTTTAATHYPLNEVPLSALFIDDDSGSDRADDVRPGTAEGTAAVVFSDADDTQEQSLRRPSPREEDGQELLLTNPVEAVHEEDLLGTAPPIQVADDDDLLGEPVVPDPQQPAVNDPVDDNPFDGLDDSLVGPAVSAVVDPASNEPPPTDAFSLLGTSLADPDSILMSIKIGRDPVQERRKRAVAEHKSAVAAEPAGDDQGAQPATPNRQDTEDTTNSTAAAAEPEFEL